MSLREQTNAMLRARRQRLIDGGVNTIPSPFKRFSADFLGWEQATYYIVTSYTKGGKTQFTSHLLFDALMYCYCHEQETGVSVKILYFPLEETKQRIMTRFYSWLLNREFNIRISPSDLKSSNNEKPVPEEILDIIDSEKFIEIVDYFEEHVIFSEESNPTGIYKFCKSYAEEHGKIFTKAKKYRDELGFEKEIQGFDHYEADNPDEYVLPVIDTINLIGLERGYNKKQAIDKLSEYCILLRDIMDSPLLLSSNRILRMSLLRVLN